MSRRTVRSLTPSCSAISVTHRPFLNPRSASHTRNARVTCPKSPLRYIENLGVQAPGTGRGNLREAFLDGFREGFFEASNQPFHRPFLGRDLLLGKGCGVPPLT